MSQSSPPASTLKSEPPTTPLGAGTVVAVAGTLDDGMIDALSTELAQRGTLIDTQSAVIPTRDVGADRHDMVRAARWAVNTTQDEDDAALHRLISSLDDSLTATVLPAAERPGAQPPTAAMLLMDVDSTLIDDEVIELIARYADREAEVAAVTEAAMRGELDFAASLHRRVAALCGLPVSVFDDVVEAVRPSCGAEELLGAFSARGWPTAAVSGGFLQVLTPLAERFGLTHHHANTLAVAEGTLTGKVEGAVVDRAAKARFLHETAAAHGLEAEQVVAVGDGANDLDMVTAAGVGVAFCAKPALQAEADLVIRHRSMRLISWALGL